MPSRSPRKDPKYRSEAGLWLGQVYSDLGKHEEALAVFRSLMGSDVRTPQQTTAAVEVIGLLADLGKLEDLSAYLDSLSHQAGVRDAIAWFANQVVVRGDELVGNRSYEAGAHHLPLRPAAQPDSGNPVQCAGRNAQGPESPRSTRQGGGNQAAQPALRRLATPQQPQAGRRAGRKRLEGHRGESRPRRRPPDAPRPLPLLPRPLRGSAGVLPTIRTKYASSTDAKPPPTPKS